MKKVLGWLLFAALVVGAVLWWLFYQSKLAEERRKLQGERKAVRVDYTKKVLDIKEDEEASIAVINVEAMEKRAAIDKREAEIDAAAAESPQALANQWNDYLKRKKA